MKRVAVQTLADGPVTRQVLARIVVSTPGPGFTELTADVARLVLASGIKAGLATVFCRHTSASLLIGENADPAVQHDLLTALDRLAPRHAGYVHDSEGPDDMPGHIRAMLTGASLSIPIMDGRLGLGTWQGIFLAEHRDAPHRREIVVNLNGG
ncbi:secondary thiamine-phosphate synthase enzyme YjbQ [Enterovirga rhinocerotis]|uniref:Secondary thiamine-phosphate synthase enzyme n=1 Tax=Enterovirga rhinocerotis TaxID=1339210 RepID=A0A4R7C8J9_9HYPH|nr:secondary thiamine-phosphate synthase enzyme YjbQ [Enterovirga rhinocerotis]TDR94960.1 secondary thiamine-phosphate synthase enzyme [Enterovirga rhinocerotis]